MTPHTIWRDGTLEEIPALGSTLMLSRALHDGHVALETVRICRNRQDAGALFRLSSHLERLRSTCQVGGLACQYSPETLAQASQSLARTENVSALRVLVLGGTSPDVGDIASTLTIILPWRASPWVQPPVRCRWSSLPSPEYPAQLRGAKLAGSLVAHRVALAEALATGYDNALLSDRDGFVTGGTQQNLFVVHGRTVTTPPADRVPISGITRDTVMTLARELGLVVTEAPITRGQLLCADEAFLTSTEGGLVSISNLEGHAFRSYDANSISHLLRSRILGIVQGLDDSHPEWLTPLISVEAAVS